MSKPECHNCGSDLPDDTDILCAECSASLGYCPKDGDAMPCLTCGRGL